MYGLKSLYMSNPEISFSHAHAQKSWHVKGKKSNFTCTPQKSHACQKEKTAASKEAAVSLYYNFPHLAHILEAAFRHATLASGGSASTGALTGMSRSPGMGGCAAGAATTTVTTTSGGDDFFDDALHFQKL